MLGEGLHQVPNLVCLNIWYPPPRWCPGGKGYKRSESGPAREEAVQGLSGGIWWQIVVSGRDG
jgi:hypothetical protein